MYAVLNCRPYVSTEGGGIHIFLEKSPFYPEEGPKGVDPFTDRFLGVTLGGHPYISTSKFQPRPRL